MASWSVGSAMASQSSSPFSRRATGRRKRSAQVRASRSPRAAPSGGVMDRSMRGSPSSTEMARALVQDLDLDQQLDDGRQRTTPASNDSSVAQDGEVFGGACGLAFAGAVLAD